MSCEIVISVYIYESYTVAKNMEKFITVGINVSISNTPDKTVFCQLTRMLCDNLHLSLALLNNNQRLIEHNAASQITHSSMLCHSGNYK